ncbi:sensor histidine kinase [Lipingzhangella sp. LS1_29]|uniref:Oxygen sensor histidine kinase NreB n=1 Tax=Lipingzhangella rawalii TaxID=2055835 RepID=A0ABU2H784_9ACTN|nr:sensor histidine kinase [Lipingzhangella rawalii]MDS1271161.1 sensor histidine kinase [Lipingzhangella rawalii]
MVSGWQPAVGQLSAGSTTVLRSLRVALHTAFFMLVAVAVVRLFTVHPMGPHTWAAAGGAVALVVLYTAGALVRRWRPSRGWALVWLAAVTAVWALLLAHNPDFSWVAFPLFFLHLYLLRGLHALVAVGVITTAVVLAQVWHVQQVSIPIVLGPALGAGCAVVLAVGYAVLYRENEHRRQLIEDLTRTQDELARSQHTAGVLAERARLAREIHDTLAQGLSSIVLLLRTAERDREAGGVGNRGDAGERAVGKIEASAAVEPLREARQAAEANLAEARRFVRALTPPDLEHDTLPQALERLCARVGREAGIDCRFHLVGAVATLPRGHEIALLRAAQASLANVRAHARANGAVVTLAFLDTEVTLDVVDNGVGFEPGQPPTAGDDTTGYGLSALRERTAVLGGELTVESTVGAGTAVAVRLPLAEGWEVPD